MMSNEIAVSRGALPIRFGVAGGGPLPRAAIPLLGMLLAIVAIWFLLVSRLFHRLRDRHRSTYEGMGSPTIFWNNSLRNQWLFLKFLLTSQWRELNDPAISRTVPLLRVWLVVYTVLFLVLVVIVLRA